jgi:heterodisulfide reductase subunit B
VPKGPSGKYTPFFGCMMATKYPQFEAAVRKTVARVGMELVDVDGFTCCPDPIYFQARDKMEWYTIAARNISLAEDLGHDIITTCSGCTATLSEVNLALKEDDGLKKEVNRRLEKIGRQYKGSINVRHAVTVMRDDFGIQAVADTVKKPMEGLKVAVHYGCHLLKPSRVMRVDDPDRPTILENLLKAIGAEPIAHDRTLLCCGKACMSDDIPDRMIIDILESIEGAGAECMGLICPTCFDQFDVKQIVLNRKYEKKFEIPIVYYFQLLGLAQGLKPEEVGLHLHKIKVDKILAPKEAVS